MSQTPCFDLSDFREIHNRNERLVLKAMEEIVSSAKGKHFQEMLTLKDYQHIYALALNKLPARYAQVGTIIIGNPVKMKDAIDAVYYAIETVLNNPKD